MMNLERVVLELDMIDKAVNNSSTPEHIKLQALEVKKAINHMCNGGERNIPSYYTYANN